MSSKKVCFTITVLDWFHECQSYLVQYSNHKKTHICSMGITAKQLKNFKRHLKIHNNKKVIGARFRSKIDEAPKSFEKLISD